METEPDIIKAFINDEPHILIPRFLWEELLKILNDGYYHKPEIVNQIQEECKWIKPSNMN